MKILKTLIYSHFLQMKRARCLAGPVNPSGSWVGYSRQPKHSTQVQNSSEP